MPQLLNGSENRYRGFWVDSHLPTDASEFAADLAFSLTHWQADGIKVVWLSITTAQASLLAVATAQGFDFHHVNGETLVLTKRLVDGAIIPEFANHTVGVGGIVFNQHGEILVIVERHDLQTRPGHWKFPGGAVDKGELIRAATVREIHEETGIKARFDEVVGMRHYHYGQFGTANIYVLCRLTALTTTITPCPEEIGKAKWISVDDYLTCDTVIAFNKILLRAALQNRGMPAIDIGDLHGIPPDAYDLFTAPP